MSFLLKEGQIIPLVVVIAGCSQILFCTVIYWWKGIGGAGNFIVYLSGRFCMIA